MSSVEWLEPPTPEDTASHPAQANATPEAMASAVAFFFLQGGGGADFDPHPNRHPPGRIEEFAQAIDQGSIRYS